MIVLLDTNVALDYILQREKYDIAKQVIDLAKTDKEIECVTATTITDIHYETSKYKEPDSNKKKYSSLDAQELLENFLEYVEVLEVTGDTIKEALKLRWKDFEDALQYRVAVENGVDCIITNNVRDFRQAEIDVMSPADFIEHRKLQLENDNTHNDPNSGGGSGIEDESRSEPVQDSKNGIIQQVQKLRGEIDDVIRFSRQRIRLAERQEYLSHKKPYLSMGL
ncbi:MAG: PIN domain-containing protein [Lachnospiraceae bacterium]|nr:PIN domain-containing protein [Lachnospiraceae bacterium]